MFGPRWRGIVIFYAAVNGIKCIRTSPFDDTDPVGYSGNKRIPRFGLMGFGQYFRGAAEVHDTPGIAYLR